jgi:hypothetical protein
MSGTAKSAANSTVSSGGGGRVRASLQPRILRIFLGRRRNQPKFELLFMLAEPDVIGHVRGRDGDSLPGAAFRLARGS